MKKFLLSFALLACSPATAQWQVPVNTVPVGRGPGVTGFSSVANTGTGTLCLLNTAPPTFGSCGSGGTPGGSNTQLQYNNAGSFGGITGATTDGTTVTLVAPILGNATATTINKVSIPAPATGATINMSNNKALTINNSLQLSGVDSTTITFQGTDTYVGRATTDTLTNKTYDTAGTGNSFSINSIAATANTGTGAVARAVSPAFTTPSLGDAVATTINKVSFPAPATAATINMSNNKTLTINNTLQLAGTDSTTITFQGTDTYVGRTTTDTLTNKTLTSPILTTPTLGVATATTINGVTLDNLAWSTYTPTVTAQTGTCTSCPATGRYKQIGKIMHVETDMQVTTIGTASGIMLLTLHDNSAAFRYAGSCFEYGATLKSGAAYINGGGDATKFQTTDATGATFFVASGKVTCSITYELP